MQNNHKINARTSQRSSLVRLLTASSSLALADILPLIVNAVFIVVFGRIYGSAALGQFSFALAVNGIALTVIDAGFDITLPRSISREPHTAYRRTFEALRVKFMIALVILPLAITSAVVKDGQTILATAILALDVLPTTLSYAILCSLRGLQFATKGAQINTAYNLLGLLICLPFTWLHLPFPVFAAIILIADMLKFLHFLSFFSRTTATHLTIGRLITSESGQPFWNSTMLRTAFYEQRGVTITNILSSLLVRMPSIMLGWFATDAQHGIYAAASRFFTSLRIVPGAVLNTIIPEYSQRSSHSARIRNVMLLALAAAALCSAFLYFGAPLLISYTFSYAESVSILQILALGFGALFLKTTLEGFLLAAHKEHLVNSVLAVVTVCAITAYAINARLSPQNVAWTISISEWVLFLALLTIFLSLKRTSRNSAEEAETAIHHVEHPHTISES